MDFEEKKIYKNQRVLKGPKIKVIKKLTQKLI